MTSRQMFEALLTELSKTNAPSMLLSDFNYFLNKAVNSYINKRYNIYDISQQTTDDLRVLKSTAILKPSKIWEGAGANISGDFGPNDLQAWGTGSSKLFGATYEVNLPLDYLHILNCVCIYDVTKRHKCYNANDNVQFAAKRLTSDSWSVILNDYYNRPLPERPYYYIHNINQSNELPTNPISSTQELDRTIYGTDTSTDYGSHTYNEYVLSYKETEDGAEIFYNGQAPNNLVSFFKQQHPTWIILRTAKEEVQSSTAKTNLPRTISLKGISNNSLVEREAGVRYGNASNVRMEIRYGRDDSVFKLKAVLVDYVKAPQTIQLTQEQVDLTEDTSQMLEFPDYVCQEIINELVHLVMENNADPRLQTHVPVSQSIAQPTQQQTQSAQ